MNAYIEAFVILLVPTVVYLLWRVWQTEKRLGSVERQAVTESYLEWRCDETSSRCIAGSEQRLKSLATALGYEWKSTPAKSGWERKDGWVYWPPLTNDGPYRFNRNLDGSDRQKGGDRRKPHQSSAQSPAQSTRNKPRRATH